MFDTQDEGGRSRAHPFLAVKGNPHCLVLIIMRINNQSQNKYDDIQ